MVSYKTLFKFGSWALLVSAAFHSLSFLIGPQATTDTEQQMLNLMQQPMDMGAGTQRSMMDLYTFFSFCMMCLCLFGGVLNLIVLKFFDTQELAKKVVSFNAIFWTLFLIPLWRMTFLPPEICFTTAWLGFAGSWLMMRKGDGLH